MTPRTRSTALFLLIICMAIPAWGQQYLLYTSQPVSSDQKASLQDGILVKEIVIKKGDTLSALSRKYSGRGTYFPQILLFNSIKNPNLIYTGNTLRVPILHKEAHDSTHIDAKPSGATNTAQPPVRQLTGPSPSSSPSTELSLSDLKTVEKEKKKAGSHKKKTAGRAKKAPSHETPAGTIISSPQPVSNKSTDAAAPAVNATDGQKLFEAAVKAYRLDDCRTALELLDRYLADNASSPLAADANLYKAECYLKLSTQ